MAGVFPCYENQFQIKVGEEMVNIADIETYSVEFSNGVETWTPYDTEGWQRAMMTAKSVTIKASGKRNVGDAGNDEVAGCALANGRDAERDFQWTYPNGMKLLFPGSPINVTNLGAADATNVAPLEFEVISNGKPTITPAPEEEAQG